MSESTFATLDLVPLLLQVLNDPSTYPTLRDLVIYYFEGSHGQSLAASLRVCFWVPHGVALLGIRHYQVDAAWKKRKFSQISSIQVHSNFNFDKARSTGMYYQHIATSNGGSTTFCATFPENALR